MTASEALTLLEAEIKSRIRLNAQIAIQAVERGHFKTEAELMQWYQALLQARQLEESEQQTPEQPRP